MAKFVKKPIEVEASQWFKHGDHPAVKDEINGEWASEVVTPETHGLIETPVGTALVSPGDYIVTASEGDVYPVHASVFEATYDEVRQDFPRPQTRGEYLVGTTFNPSANDTVSKIKAQAAALIDLIDGRGFPMDEDKGRTGNGEVARCKATAITNIEQGVMWAVKAATKPRRD